jgi:hypothetical protein
MFPGPRATTGRAVTGLPARQRHRVRRAAGTTPGAADQQSGPVAGRADRDRRPAPHGREYPADRCAAGAGTIDDQPGVCAATRSPVATTALSRLIGVPPPVGRVGTGDGSIATANCGGCSLSCSGSGGVRNRSAAICADGSPTNRECRCVTRASTRPSISPDRHFCARRSWLRSIVDRYAPAATHRRAHQRGDRRRPRFEQPMLTHPPPLVPSRRPLRSRTLGRRSCDTRSHEWSERADGRFAGEGVVPGPCPLTCPRSDVRRW